MKTSNLYKVASFLSNPNGYLKLRNLLGYMYDVALIQSNIVEKEEWKDKYAWVIYSWDVEIIEPIKTFDEIEVSTHSINMNKFYAYRNYSVKKEGKTCIKAYCVLLLIDRKRLRPVKIPKEIEEAYGKEKFIYDGREINFEENFDQKKKLWIRKTDLDSNHHVNNAAYMDIISDLISIEEENIEYFKIIYKNEIRNKDFVLGEVKEGKKESDFRLISEDGKVYTYGKMIRKNV